MNLLSWAFKPAYEQKPFEIGDNWTALIEPSASGEAMAIAQHVRLWRAKPAHQQHLALPTGEKQSLWIQVIDGELSLHNNGTPEHSLRRGDGMGLIQDAATQSTLIGLGERADVLLFALA